MYFTGYWGQFISICGIKGAILLLLCFFVLLQDNDNSQVVSDKGYFS